jgi:hypothetical protein
LIVMTHNLFIRFMLICPCMLRQLIYGVSFILLLMQGLYQKEFWSL